MIGYKQQDEVYLEVANIEDGKLSQFIPMDDRFLRKLTEFSGNKRGKDQLHLLPCDIQLLAVDFNPLGGRKLMWAEPPSKKMLYFSKSLNIKDGNAGIPAILYLYQESEFSIWALKKYPVTETTTTYRLPLFNIYDSGEICMGSAKIDIGEFVIFEAMEACKTAFWSSKFAHTNTDKKVSKTNISALWNALIENRKPFDPEELVSPYKTIKEIRDVL